MSPSLFQNVILLFEDLFSFRTMEVQTNDMAFFRITTIDFTGGSPDTANDIYAQCKSGELGSRVDPAVTRVIQQGVENSRIPSLVGISGKFGISLSNHNTEIA